MKIILTQEVTGLGAPGDVVEVKDGYGRNYLLPQAFAIRWSKGAEKQITLIKRARSAREIRDLGHANEVRDRLDAGHAGAGEGPLVHPEDVPRRQHDGAHGDRAVPQGDPQLAVPGAHGAGAIEGHAVLARQCLHRGHPFRCTGHHRATVGFAE